MTQYRAPVRDMLFTMREVGGLSEIAALPGNEEVTDDLIEAIFEEAGKFAADVLSPLNQVGDRQGCQVKDGVVTTPDGVKQAYAAFCENGWNAMPVSAAWGGQGLPQLVNTPVMEMWTAANLAFSLCQMLTMGAISAIEHHGTEEQKALFLPKMTSGQWTGTMNLSEPQAGSDLAAVHTKAVPEGDHYRITGTKIFITWGENDVAENIIHLVLARLPDAPAGVKGISLFIAPKFLVNADGSLGARNDLVCASLEHKLGIHASPTAVMAFGEKGGAIGALVGEANRGLEYMFTMMNHARFNVGLEGVAIAERATQQAFRYALERVQGRPQGCEAEKSRILPIAYHPDVKRMLLDMKARVEALRAVAYYTAGRMDVAEKSPDAAAAKKAQALVDLLVPVVKGVSTESSVLIASTGIQVHGGTGFIEETGAAQHYRDSRITPIYEGTTGIQANDFVGRKIARDGGAAAKLLIEDLGAEAGNDPELVAGLASFGKVVDWIVATHKANPERTAASAVAALNLAGIVVGACLLAKQARAAQSQLDNIGKLGGDPGFLKGKIAVSRYFTAHVLAQAESLAVTITKGHEAINAFDPGSLNL